MGEGGGGRGGRGEGGKGGEGGRGGAVSQKIFFSPFGPQFGRKTRWGQAPPGPFPTSATVKFPVVDHRRHHGERSISCLLSHLDKCLVALDTNRNKDHTKH